MVVSVGAESSYVAVELARHAESVGAAAVMATPPLATACDEAELLRYYERLIRAVGCPVVVQDASGYLGTPLPTSSMVQLHREFGDRVMFKPEGKSAGTQLAALAEATAGRAALFAGGGGAALAEHFPIGLAGVMCGADLVTGIVALWRALRAADHARAARLAAQRLGDRVARAVAGRFPPDRKTSARAARRIHEHARPRARRAATHGPT